MKTPFWLDLNFWSAELTFSFFNFEWTMNAGSVQVMLFSNGLEVYNPGLLPPSLTLEKLRVAHGSVPGNPLLAEPMYLTRYIERMGAGTVDMIRRCVEAGLPEPEFAVTDGFQTIIHRFKNENKAGPLPLKSSHDVDGREAREETREKIISLITANPFITMDEMARKTGITSKGIE